MGRLEIDNALIWQARLGQENAWDELMNAFIPIFTGMARKIARAPHENSERQDLIAEGLLVLVESVKEWDGINNFPGPLIRKTKGRMSKMYYALFQKGPTVPRTTLQRVAKVEKMISEGRSVREALELYNKPLSDQERISVETFTKAFNAKYTREVTEYE